MISCSVILSFICSYFLFLLFDLVTGEMQRRKAVQQPGSAGRAHRLPQEQPYRLPARRASFRGPGQARDGPRVEEAGYPLRRVQEVNSWRFCIVLYYKRICKWRTSNNSIFSSVLQIPKIYGMGVTTAHPLRIVRLGLNLSKQFISYVNWILMLTVNCKKQFMPQIIIFRFTDIYSHTRWIDMSRYKGH